MLKNSTSSDEFLSSTPALPTLKHDVFRLKRSGAPHQALIRRSSGAPALIIKRLGYHSVATFSLRFLNPWVTPGVSSTLNARQNIRAVVLSFGAKLIVPVSKVTTRISRQYRFRRNVQFSNFSKIIF